MRRWWWACLGLALWLAVAAPAETLRVAVPDDPTGTYYPFMQTLADHGTEGLCYDVLDAVVALSGDNVVKVFLSVVRSKRALSEGVADLELFSNPAWRAEYAADSLYTQPYLVSQDVFIQRPDAPRRLTRVTDLFGQSLVTVRGFSYGALDALLNSDQIHRQEAPNSNSVLHMVESGRADAGVINKTVFLALVHQQGPRALIVGPPASEPLPISMRFARGKTAAVDRFNGALAKLRRNGTLAALFGRYGLAELMADGPSVPPARD